MFAMTGALPPHRPATLVLEIPGSATNRTWPPLSTRISWLYRLAGPAGDPSALAAGAAEVELPQACRGRGRASHGEPARDA